MCHVDGTVPEVLRVDDTYFEGQTTVGKHGRQTHRPNFVSDRTPSGVRSTTRRKKKRNTESLPSPREVEWRPSEVCGDLGSQTSVVTVTGRNGEDGKGE